MGVTYPPGRSPEDLARKMSAMMKRTQDMTPAMKVGAEAIDRLMKKSFDVSRSPTDIGWAPLTDETIKKRRKNSSTPLVDTGMLRKRTVARAGARTIYFSSNVAYAGYQQFGTRYIPARPFMPITRSGDLTDDAGPAKLVFDRIAAQVGSFIINGRLR
jgi:phage gpG-like protein